MIFIENARSNKFIINRNSSREILFLTSCDNLHLPMVVGAPVLRAPTITLLDAPYILTATNFRGKPAERLLAPVAPLIREAVTVHWRQVLDLIPLPVVARLVRDQDDCVRSRFGRLRERTMGVLKTTRSQELHTTGLVLSYSAVGIKPDARQSLVVLANGGEVELTDPLTILRH